MIFKAVSDDINLAENASIEITFAGVGQVISGIKYDSFLTPDVASKYDARNGIDLSVQG